MKLVYVLGLTADKSRMRNSYIIAQFFFVVAQFLLSGSQALALGAGITYQGRLIDPSGKPVVSSSVQFKVQLRTPGAEDCLMYEEVQTKNLSETDGVFSLSLFDGSGLRIDLTGYNLQRIFANKGSYTFSNGECASGTSWTPNPTDGRRIQVAFNDGTFAGGTWETAPAVPINFIPMAIEALQLSGYQANQILRLADGVSTTGTELNGASWAELLALIGGTTTQYLKSGAATFTAAPQWNGVPSGANDLVNKTYVDAQVAAGLPNVGTAGTYTKVVTDTKGRVTSGSALVEADVPTLSTAGKVGGGALNSGTIGGSTAINSSGNLITTGTVSGATVNATNLRVFNGANYVQLAAPALGGNLSFSLPAADGAAGALLKTNGAGQLSFGALAASDIPSLDATKITTGTLPVGRGGTGQTSYGNNSVLVSNAAGNGFNSLNCVFGKVIKFDVSGFAGCGDDTAGGGSQWTTTSSDIYYNAGNVGIGTATPSSTLHVIGTNGTSGNAQEALTVVGGTGGANSKGGNLVLTGGTGGSGVGTGTGGDITMTSGAGGPGSGRAGAVTISGGSGGDGGGLVTVQGGSFSASSFGAKLLLYAGDSSTTGSASLTTGNGGGTTGPVGGITLQTGSSSMGGNVGNIVIAGGAGSGTGTGSSILMTAGAGGATNINGSNIVLNGGAKGGSGSDGNVILANTRGNVGIGTASPNYALNIEKNVNGGSRLQINNPNLGAGAFAAIGVGADNNSGTANADFMYIGQSFPAGGGAHRPRGTVLEGNDIGGLSIAAYDPVGYLTFYTGGITAAKERIRVDASGNVGIGTSTPNSLLDVNGTMRVSQICDSAGSNCKTVSGGWSAAPGLSALTAATGTGTIDNTNYAQSWNWSTATTQNTMEMTANALTTGTLLNLTSSSATLNSTNGLLNVANTSAATTGTVARIQSNSTAGSGLTVLANGNVGIGTANPGAKLDVSYANGSNGIRINNQTSPVKAYLTQKSNGEQIWSNNIDVTDTLDVAGKSAWKMSLSGSDSLDAFNIQAISAGQTWASWRNLFKITNAGNVGIGTASPTSPLHAYGVNAGTGIFQVESSTSGVVFKAGSSTGAMVQMVGAGGIVSVAGGPGTGRLNVGSLTSNSVSFAINGIVGQTADLFRVDTTTGTTGAAFKIDASGNVGIGTINPSEKLEVSGNIKGTQLCIGADCRSAWPSGTNSPITIETKVSNFTVTTGDIGKLYIVSGPTTVSLPTAASAGSGFKVTIKRIDAANVVILPLTAECSSGTHSIAADYGSVDLVSTGSQWIRLAPVGITCTP